MFPLTMTIIEKKNTHGHQQACAKAFPPDSSSSGFSDTQMLNWALLTPTVRLW